MSKLPVSVKQLLTLRNPLPLPGPPLARLQHVLRSTFEDAQSKKAETGWLVLTVRPVSDKTWTCTDNGNSQTCTLLAANRPSTISPLYKFITGPENDSAAISRTINKVAIMREAALKSTVFVGVPRVSLRSCLNWMVGWIESRSFFR